MEMAPLLAEAYPRALAHFYQTASRGRAVDDFVAGPSGVGYAFHNYLPDRAAFARRTARMKAADLTITTMLNANGDGAGAELLAQPEIMGVIYKDYAPYNAKEGRIFWHEGKPCVSYRYLLWDPSYRNNPEGVAEAIAGLPASPQTDQNSYAFINVHRGRLRRSAGRWRLSHAPSSSCRPGPAWSLQRNSSFSCGRALGCPFGSWASEASPQSPYSHHSRDEESEMLRIAMLSMAHVHANGYAQAVVDHPEAEIVKIWEDDPGRGAAATERLASPTRPTSRPWSAVPTSTPLSSTPSPASTLVIKTAVKYGKHVFTEKALCVKTKDADEIVEAVNKSGIKFMISLPSRTRPETLFCRRRSWMRVGLAISRSMRRALPTTPPSTPGSTTAAPGSPMRPLRAVVRSSTWVVTPST